MKTPFKDVVYIIVIILLLFGVGYFFVQNKNKNDSLDRLQRNYELANQEIVTYRTKNNELVSEIESQQYTIKEFASIETELKDRVKEITGKYKKLNSYTKFSSVTKGEVKVIDSSGVRIVDKEGARLDKYSFGFEDKYMTLGVSINTIDSTGNVENAVEYQYRSSYELVSSWKKPEGGKLFAKKHLLLDVVANNPNETITGISSVVILPPPTSFLNSKTFWAALGAGAMLLLKLLIQ